MGVTARATEETVLRCVRCDAPYHLFGAIGQPRMQMRCATCGFADDVWVAPAGGEAKWTMIDPTGTVTSFTTWSELLSALRNSGISAVHESTHESTHEVTSAPLEEPTRRSSLRAASAATLLDETPQTPSMRPSLVLVEDSAHMKAAPEALDALPSLEAGARDDREKAAPKDPRHDWDEDEEVISLRDIQVVVPPPAAPQPPARGTLRTLPPPAGATAPPPPTISVEDVAALAEPSEPAIPLARAKAEAKTTEKARSGAASKPKAMSARPPPEREADEQSWLLPMTAVAAVVLGVWYFTSGSHETPRAHVEPAVAPAETTAEAPAAALDPTPVPPVAAAVPVAAEPAAENAEKVTAPIVARPAEKPAGDPQVDKAAGDKPEKTERPREKRAAVDTSGLTPPEMLDQASTARRGGDLPRARELYEHVLAQNAGNVEAHTGLAAVARAQGDLAGAKSNYEKALASSPSSFPAMLGLADVEWDLGDQDAAKRHYVEVVRNAPSAPDRARDRAGIAKPAE